MAIAHAQDVQLRCRRDEQHQHQLPGGEMRQAGYGRAGDAGDDQRKRRDAAHEQLEVPTTAAQPGPLMPHRARGPDPTSVGRLGAKSSPGSC